MLEYGREPRWTNMRRLKDGCNTSISTWTVRRTWMREPIQRRKRQRQGRIWNNSNVEDGDVIYQLKNNNAGGKDGIVAELNKIAIEKFAHAPTSVVAQKYARQKVWKTTKIQMSFSDSVSLPALHKFHYIHSLKFGVLPCRSASTCFQSVELPDKSNRWVTFPICKASVLRRANVTQKRLTRHYR